jgi:hypothetical protein
MIPSYFKQFLAIALMLIGAVVVSESLSAQCVPPPSGMVAWWLLDETSGPTANDIVGSVNNAGTWMNSPVPVTGMVGGALSFSGSNSVDVPDQAELNFGTGDFSIDLWIKTTAASGLPKAIVDKRIFSGTYKGYLLFLYNGCLSSQIGDGSYSNNWVSTGFVADGNWHHIAVTVDRDNPSGWRFYVDGSLVGPIGHTMAFQGSLTNTAPFVMARNLLTPTHTFAGTLDEIELFNRVLDSSEIRSIWAADSAGKCKDTCHATGDANNNGLALTTADLTYLAAFINGPGPAPIPLYSCDLNGDGYVDPADLLVYQNYFLIGMSAFAPYGGYPVLCPCDPIPAPVPDTVNIFGLEHVSVGPTCLGVSGGELIITRFMAAMAPEGITVDIPDAISSPSSIIWRGEFGEDPTLETGATIQVDCAGIVYGVPDQYIGSSKQVKQANGAWDLSVKEGANSYTVKAYLSGTVVWSKTGIAAPGEWFNTGNFSSISKAPNTGPHTQTMSNIDDAGIVAVGWGDQHDTVAWNWPGQGVVGLAVDRLSIIPEGLDSSVTGLSSIGIYGEQIDSLTITSEELWFSFGDVMVTSLGNATITPMDTMLVVSNIGSSGFDGMDAEHDSKDGEWSIVWKNPDQSGTFPTGASVGTEFFFATPTRPDSLSMGLSMTKAAANTWNLAVQSGASTYTIQAFNNGLSVFSVVGASATGLGYIVETAKGVTPTTMKGAGTGKPASVVASADYDFTASSGGVQWTWAAHGVSGLPIDYLSISTEVPGTRLFGVTHTQMCGDNGAARSDPISFTILDIDVQPSYVCGDANGDGSVDISDAVYLIVYIFSGGSAPEPLEAGDANCDGAVDISDVVYLIVYIFSGGAAPCAP